MVNAVSTRPLLLLLDGHSSHFELTCNLFSSRKIIKLLSSVFHRTPHTSVSLLMSVILDHSKGTGSKNAIDSTKITRLVLSQSLILTPFFVRHGTKLYCRQTLPMGSRRQEFILSTVMHAVKVVNHDVQHTGEADDTDNVGGENNPGTRNSCFLPPSPSLSLTLPNPLPSLPTPLNFIEC